MNYKNFGFKTNTYFRLKKAKFGSSPVALFITSFNPDNSLLPVSYFDIYNLLTATSYLFSGCINRNVKFDSICLGDLT